MADDRHPPMVPDTILHGRASFAWQDNGAFLVWRSEIEDDRRFPNGIAIFGSDDAAGTLFISYFDERGISRKYDVTLAADGFQMHRDDPKLAQRMTFKMSPDGRTMTCTGEMSQNGGPWGPDLSLNCERV